jgi:hypothetical protein
LDSLIIFNIEKSERRKAEGKENYNVVWRLEMI